MAWTTPVTAVSGALLTAAQWNASVRDNLLETAPAKATTSGRIFVSTGANAIAQREIRTSIVAAGETTASTSFTNLATAGPTITSITTGPLALISVNSQANNTLDGPSSRHSFDISGATTSSATSERGTLSQNSASKDTRYGICTLQTVTAGSNTFTSKYLVSSGTGHWQDRELIVMAL